MLRYLNNHIYWQGKRSLEKRPTAPRKNTLNIARKCFIQIYGQLWNVWCLVICSFTLYGSMVYGTVLIFDVAKFIIRQENCKKGDNLITFMQRTNYCPFTTFDVRVLVFWTWCTIWQLFNLNITNDAIIVYTHIWDPAIKMNNP